MGNLSKAAAMSFSEKAGAWWSSAKKGASKAGTSISKNAQITKIQADVAFVKRSIDSQKKEFGVAVFDHMRAGEQEIVQQFLQQYQATIAGLEAQIAAKEEEIAKLREEIAQLDNPDGAQPSQ